MSLEAEARVLAENITSMRTELGEQLAGCNKDLAKEIEVERRANEHGDRSENAEWQIAKDNIARLSNTKREIEIRIRDIDALSERAKIDGIISVGSIVRVYDTSVAEEVIFKVVPKGVGDAKRRLIAMGTPVMNAMFGKTAGEEVAVVAPRGEIKMSILEVL